MTPEYVDKITTKQLIYKYLSTQKSAQLTQCTDFLLSL